MDMLLKRKVRRILSGVKHLLDGTSEPPPCNIPFDNRYDWLGASFQKIRRDPFCATKPAYIWGILQGTALAKVLGFERVSVIELGVAGGKGLLRMEEIAERVEEMVGVGIDVYGFDSGAGIPMTQDYKDMPNVWMDGQFAMDKKELEKRLRRAKLKLGPVKDTVPAFMESSPAPVAFVSFDLDIYSSTRDALQLFNAKEGLLLPRVLCYFDDIFGLTYSDYNGERLAISEFNDAHIMRKLSPLYGLKFYVPPVVKDDAWPEQIYFLHIFDHSLYNRPDELRKPMRMEIDGKVTGYIPTAHHPSVR
jgi:hypothetical protein